MEQFAGKQGLIYRAFRCYIRLVNDRFFYRRVYYLNKENIPDKSVPTIIVSNHQNCLNDALSIALSFNDRKPQFIVRADIFNINKFFDRLLRMLGLLPAYRLNFDGEEALSKNDALFDVSEAELIKGATIVMFPEGTHQDKHYLGDFSFGYLKLAFEAAEKTQFMQDIQILPACNHYSDYFGLQTDMLVKYGEPISLQPFYELYKTKPRTARRQVNAVVRQRISDMMLNITDIQNYEALDLLRDVFHLEYSAKYRATRPALPDLLLADKVIVAAFEESSSVKAIYDEITQLAERLKDCRLSYDVIAHPPKFAVTALKCIGLALLSPLWLFAFAPNTIIYIAPKLFMLRFTDKMFTNTVLFAMSVLITLPLSYLTLFLLTWHYFNFCIAGIYTLSLPYLGLFAWYYGLCFRRTQQELRFLRLRHKGIILKKIKKLTI